MEEDTSLVLQRDIDNKWASESRFSREVGQRYAR